MHILSSPSSRRSSAPRFAARIRTLSAALTMAALAAPQLALAQTATFNTLVTTYKGNPSFAHPGGAAVADFNGDGKLDSVLFDGTPTLRLMQGNGDGTFAQRDVNVPAVTVANAVGLSASFTPYLPHAVDGIIRSVRAADVNGDGRPDIVCLFVIHLNFAPLWGTTVLINSGNDANGVAQFTSATHYFSAAADTRSLTVGDLNGDGKPDFITGCAYGSLEFYRNNGDGTFTFTHSTNVEPNVGGAVGPGAIADLNGDGKADFIVTDNQATATDIFFGNGDGTFQSPVVISNNAVALAVGDLNGDGKPDFVEAYGDGTLAVFLNNGAGVFGTPLTVVSGMSGVAAAIATADMNGDGNLDLIATNGSSANGTNGVAILLGNGDGTLGAATLFKSNALPVDVATVDFNGDGKPDIGIVGLNDDTYGVLTNTTVFAPPLATQTLTILGGNGNLGDVAANVEYYNPATSQWQPAYLAYFPGNPGLQHPWGTISGTNAWINYRANGASDAAAGPTVNQTLWYQYRVRFTVPADAIDPKMTFSIKADNFAQVAINGAVAGGDTVFINNAYVNNVIQGTANGVNADAVFSQAVHPGENTITINVGDFGGLNGFNFRVDLTMKSSQPLEIVTPPAVPAPVVTSATANGTYNTPFSYQISATNAPTSYNATGLPSGLMVSSSGAITGTPTQVGTFSVGLSATNAGGTGAGTLTLAIAKAAASITLGGLSQTYDGTAKNATATTDPAGLTVALSYLGDHTNAGSSQAMGVIDNPNYSGSANGTLVIAKANATISVSGYTGTYDGGAHGATGTAKGVDGATLAGLSLGATFTNAPGGTAHWTFAGGANYNDASGDVAVAIAKANATVVVTPYNVEYDGQPHSATASIVGVNGESGATVGSVTLNSTHTAVGVYSGDSWSFQGAGNYNSIAATPIVDTIKDTTAPVIASVTPSTATLWPPNHQMVAITLNVAASDLVGVTGYNVTATSSEPDNGLGDGDTANDIQIVGSGSLNPVVNLRAERSGKGNGRTYTITVQAFDAAGNLSAPQSCTVFVPANQKKH